jgi:hypothetical protein
MVRTHFLPNEPNFLCHFKRSRNTNGETAKKIRTALQASGVEFTDENGCGAAQCLFQPLEDKDRFAV